jgi:hypothetical protein
LKANSRGDLRVFAVWEPVLLTDWRRPSAAQTSYIPDPRATHFFDNTRRLSALYGGPDRRDSLAQTREVGFRMKGVLWDAALVYPPGVRWGGEAKFLFAPVVRHRDELAEALR